MPVLLALGLEGYHEKCTWKSAYKLWAAFVLHGRFHSSLACLNYFKIQWPSRVPCDLNWSLRMMMSMAKHGSSAPQGFPWCLQQSNTKFRQFQHQGNGSRQRACSLALLVRIPQVFCQAWTQQPSRMVRNLLLLLLSRFSRVRLCATP